MGFQAFFVTFWLCLHWSGTILSEEVLLLLLADEVEDEFEGKRQGEREKDSLAEGKNWVGPGFSPLSLYKNNKFIEK